MITPEEYADEYRDHEGNQRAWLCNGPCGCPGGEAAHGTRPCHCSCYGCWHHCGACHCRMRREDPDWPYFWAGELREGPLRKTVEKLRREIRREGEKLAAVHERYREGYARLVALEERRDKILHQLGDRNHE